MNAERHPKGLYVLFFTEMWERFGFYSMLAMFTLYLRNDKQGFGWTSEAATSLYANYLMFVYASPLIGGWIADWKLGYRNSVLIGGVVFMVGYFLLAIHDIAAVYAALVCLVVGNGFFKPNVSAMVGHLYPEGSALKDRAYNIFYMGINIGALLAPINAEIFVNVYGFNIAFAVAGFGMIVSVFILWGFTHVIDSDRAAAVRANTAAASQGQARSNPIDLIPEGRRIVALIVIFVVVIVFWMVFHQNGSTITYWADDNTNWQVSGIISNAINPFWVVALTFPVVWVSGWLNRRGLEPSTPAKMALGMFFVTASFVILYFAARAGETQTITPDMLTAGDFRITDRSLSSLEKEGVPKEMMEDLNRKDAKGNSVIKGRKFQTDRTFEDALTTIQQDFDEDVAQAKADLRRHRDEEKVIQLRSREGEKGEIASEQAKAYLASHRAKEKALREKLERAENDARALKDVKIEEGKRKKLPPIAERGSEVNREFVGALDQVVKDAEGLSSAGAMKVGLYKSRELTGRDKFYAALARPSVLGIEDAAKYAPVIEKQAYLFKVSPAWLIIAIAVVTLGELMLSPMGLSLVSKVAPVHLRGLMMGGWFLATAIGNKLTAIGVYWEVWRQSTFFLVLGAMALAMGFVLLVLLRPLKKAMPGV